MKLTWNIANKLTMLGWGGWFVVAGIKECLHRGVNEVSVVYMMAPFVLFFLYFVDVKIPLRDGNDKKYYEIGGFVSLNCLALALFFTDCKGAMKWGN